MNDSGVCSSFKYPFNPIIPQANVASDTTHLILFSSRHPGGVNMAFLDGGVRFLRNGIAQRIREAMGSRAGGEAFTLN